MKTIQYMIESIPSFRTGLMRSMDPISAIRLRRALGGKPLMSPLESLRYASFASILGINMDWLSFMGRAGCHVALIGANLYDVQDAVDRSNTSSAKWPFKIMMICTMLTVPGSLPAEAHDMKWAFGDCEMLSDDDGNCELNMVRNGMHFTIAVPSIKQASNQTLVLRLDGKITEHIFSSFDGVLESRCVWMNTELFPTRSNLLRTINTVSIASPRAPEFGDEPIRTLDFTGTGIEIVWWTSSTDWMTFQKCHRLHAALVLPPDQNGDCCLLPAIVQRHR